MARYNKSRSKNKNFFIAPTILVGAVCAALATVLTFILKTFDVHDPSWFYYATDHTYVRNVGGVVGAHIAATLFYLFGTACYLMVPLLAGVAYLLWKQPDIKEDIDRVVMGMLLMPMVSTFMYVYKIGHVEYMINGGLVGQNWYLLLRNVGFDHVTIVASLYVSFIASFFIMSRLSFIATVQKGMETVSYIVRCWRSWVLPVARFIRIAARGFIMPFRWLFDHIHNLLCVSDLHESDQSVFAFEAGAEKEGEFETEPFWDEYMNKQSAVSEAAPHADMPPSDFAPVKDKVMDQVKKKKIRLEKPSSELDKKYTVPHPGLLNVADKIDKNARADEDKMLAQILEEKLERFGVYGEVASIKRGPIITLFEYQPDIDAKVSKILSLGDDLALALEAVSVRIVAPIPGTSRVGFEVANKDRQVVMMGDITRSTAFQNNKGALPFVLGKDTSGGNVVVDMVDMPHLLVAGSTGAGKSVALNTMLVSWLCKLSPEQLKLIIIDPKRLEFAAYKDIPHLLFPIITQSAKAAPVLRWLVKVMEERYEMMAEKGVRSIGDYKKMCKRTGEKDELPYIVLMIDELADLMMVARKDVEDSIARLAQMARAAGIHLIVATQRPSVDVLTGLIKVNFPSRVSFRVTSKVDSRTILDALGAETLLGKGDMLFIDSSSSRMRRIHGAYVSDAEISAIVNHVKAQQKVEYMDIQEAMEAYSDAADAAEEPLIPEVLEYLKTIDEISISSLQRRFKIGYNRSARLIEMLEAQGKVMPATGSKMRRVIH